MKNKLLTSIPTMCFLCVAAGQASAAETTSLAELGVAHQALVSAGLGAEDERYHVRAEGESFLLGSPAQGLTASLGGSGIEVRGSNGAVGMRLLGWGCESALAPATGWSALAEANRVEFAREGITEWYVAGPMGVEQGFTVPAPRAGCESAGQLVIELAVAGSVVLGVDGLSLDFPEAGLRYSGLYAVDAVDRELPAHFELAGKRLEIRTEVTSSRWPVTVDPTFEVAKLLASDGDQFHVFGEGVAISGSTIVVGDSRASLGGGVYVFTEPVGGWTGTLTESAKLLASDGEGSDYLGTSVAVSGSTVVASSPGDDDSGDLSGSAYVFTEPVGGWAGTLTESAKLLASDGAENDEFAVSVAISGSTIVVGARLDDDSGGASGSAYVFTEPVGGWAGLLNETAKLLASDGAPSDIFGRSVAVSGGSIVVGAPFDDPHGSASGSAYVFTEPVGGWAGTLNEAAKLIPSDGSSADDFGYSVAVSGSTIVSGAWADDDSGDLSGSAYVFTEPVGGWAGTLEESAKLLASDGVEGDIFGWSVAVSGNTVTSGAPILDIAGTDIPSAYVFTEPVDGWAGLLNETAILQVTDGTPTDDFGFSVAVSGGSVVVGAPLNQGGAAYVYLGPWWIFTDGFESGDTTAWSSTVP